MKFELNTIAVNGPNIRGKVFWTRNPKFFFEHNEEKFDKMAKIAMDPKYDYYVLSF